MQHLKYLLLVVLLACTLAACSSADGSIPLGVASCASNVAAWQALSGAPHHTLVFVDRSSSADGTETLYADSLKGRILRDLFTRGSTLGLYYVHDRTTGMAGRASFSQQAALPRATPYDNENAQHCNDYAAAIQQDMKTAWQQAQPLLGADVARANRDGTDLWGVLEVASDAFAAIPDSVERRVYVFSDLLECMPGAGRRCFETRPPASRQQAEAWGRDDAARVQQQLRVAPEALRPAHFTLLAGHHALRDETRFAGYYWRALLETLGVPPTQITVG